jgi:hypothetical protein
MLDSGRMLSSVIAWHPSRPTPVPLWSRRAFGTIGHVSEHRVRLTDEDLEVILAALSARRAMYQGVRRHRLMRLFERLSEMTRGNPKWIIDELGQTHEEDLEVDESI